MDRRSILLPRPAALLALALAAFLGTGCKAGLESLAYIWQGTELPAECEVLRGKKVAVVCEMLASEDFTSAGAAGPLSQNICKRLKANVKKIRIVDPQKVAALIDEKGMLDNAAIGKALKAEKVVRVKIGAFGVREDATVYRGRAKVSIEVFDVAENSVEWQESPPEIVHPDMIGIHVAEVTEPEFRRQFVTVLADRIAAHFYPHDKYDDFCRDRPTP